MEAEEAVEAEEVVEAEEAEEAEEESDQEEIRLCRTAALAQVRRMRRPLQAVE